MASCPINSAPLPELFVKKLLSIGIEIWTDSNYTIILWKYHLGLFFYHRKVFERNIRNLRYYVLINMIKMDKNTKKGKLNYLISNDEFEIENIDKSYHYSILVMCSIRNMKKYVKSKFKNSSSVHAPFRLYFFFEL